MFMVGGLVQRIFTESTDFFDGLFSIFFLYAFQCRYFFAALINKKIALKRLIDGHKVRWAKIF